MQAEIYRDNVAPPSERCQKLVLRPSGFKARLWRAFDDSVQVLLRLDVPLRPHDIEDHALRDLMAGFPGAFGRVGIYLQRGSATALPMPWSVGRLTVERDSVTGFLHRFLDDPFGGTLATLFRAGDARADVTLSLSAYEISRERLVFAVRDYDVGAGADFGR